MKGALFLSGGGSERDSYLLDREFAKLLRGKLLYIPIAIDTKKHPFPECFKWIKSVFGQFGFSNIEMWTSVKDKTLDNLREFDAVYIGGGNTFKLLKEFRDSGFDKLLVEFYRSGGHIYGGSAGAIILGRNIITASKDDENEVGLKDFRGLELVGDYSILCHYNRKDDTFIKKIITEYGLKIIALEEDAGIIVKDGITPCGYGNAWVFDEKKKLQLSETS